MDSLATKLILNAHSKRSLQLLMLLEVNSDLTLSEISQKTNLSKRTIQADLNDLRYLFGDAIDLNGSLSGMRMTIHDYECYYAKKKLFFDQEPLIRMVTSFFSKKKRTLPEWGAELNFSLSTLNRMLTTLRDELAEYHIELITSPLSIRGEEVMIRKFYWDLFCESTYFEFDDSSELSSKIGQLFPDISLKKVKKIIHLTYQRMGEGELSFPVHVREFLTNSYLYKEILATLCQMSRFKRVPYDKLEDEAFFICIMVYAHCDFRGKTNVPLTNLSQTAANVADGLYEILRERFLYLGINCDIHEVYDFLSRQYAKVLLDPIYIKNDCVTNKFAQSLDSDLFDYLKNYLNSLKESNYFTGAWVSDFCASLIVYLYLNKKIGRTHEILVILSNGSLIDETVAILLERFFYRRLTIVYEDTDLEKKIKGFKGHLLITNIIPFEYQVHTKTKLVYLPRISKVTDIGLFFQSILEDELSFTHSQMMCD
ncbi:helix-turn-helix domain-containing protein [Enterococcus sp. AZ173]|uniref:helix-turn-helix domain-containing protein n=1 Tax=Enterococcus sp. AZ173 TaxID=2774700 RepID=UPI003D2906CF